MDPELVKKYEESTKDFQAKIFGPQTPEYEEFAKRQKIIDMKRVMGPNTNITNHYLVDDAIVLTSTLMRGYYEGRDIEFTEDDIVFTSYPKSGTTWLQMIGLHALYDCDVEKVKSLNVDLAAPAFEMPECTLKEFKERPSPRYIKSHMPYALLPSGKCNKKYKILHVTRNPKDLAVSLYHFYKMMATACLVGDVKSIVNAFINDSVIYSPFDQHCLGYWEHRNDDNVLFIKYEDLHKDTVNQVKRICKFLGKNFTDDQIHTIIRATSFDQMAANPNAHHGQWVDASIADANTFNFMRKGKIGDWKNHFDEELNKKFDEWIEKRFGHTDLKFDYE